MMLQRTSEAAPLLDYPILPNTSTYEILKEAKFLKKLWCCLGGGVWQDNFGFINWVDNVNWPL